MNIATLRNLANAQAEPFVPSNSNDNRTNVLTNNQQVSRPNVPPSMLQQNAAQPIEQCTCLLL